MKRIETIMRRSEYDSFRRCASRLGIFAFDLYQNNRTGLRTDFAVSDIDAKETVHAVLNEVHPDSIAIFKLDDDALNQDIESQPLGGLRELATKGH